MHIVGFLEDEGKREKISDDLLSVGRPNNKVNMMTRLSKVMKRKVTAVKMLTLHTDWCVRSRLYLVTRRYKSAAVCAFGCVNVLILISHLSQIYTISLKTLNFK